MCRLFITVTIAICPLLAAQAQNTIEVHAGPEFAIHPDLYSRHYPATTMAGLRYNTALSRRWKFTARGGYGYANARGEDGAHLDLWTLSAGMRLHPDKVGIDDYIGLEVGRRSLRAEGVGIDGETPRTDRDRYLAGRAYIGFMIPAISDYVAVEPAVSAFLVERDPYVSVSLQVVLPIW